jgi:hypothetical protein
MAGTLIKTADTEDNRTIEMYRQGNGRYKIKVYCRIKFAELKSISCESKEIAEGVFNGYL